MKALIQRVSQAGVGVGGEPVSSIGPGLLVLLAVEKGDAESDLEYIARKVANLRIFEDADGKMNRSVMDTGGEVLVVSQFTLAGDTRKGNRPSFVGAEEPGRASEMCDEFAEELRVLGVPTRAGRFGACMQVSLVNDGPVTILIESRNR